MENGNHMAFWTAIGAAPTPLAWAEVFIALQNGTIDAHENAADTVLGANIQEVQKYLGLHQPHPVRQPAVHEQGEV